MKLDDLNFETLDALENYELGLSLADDCLQALLLVCKSKEGAVRALLGAYGEWWHIHLMAKEKLEQSMSEIDIQKLRAEYYDKYYNKTR